MKSEALVPYWRRLVPLRYRERLHELRERPRRVRLGDLDRLTPIETHWGRTRGGAVDREYIEQFLASHRGDIRGHVMEVADLGYTEQFGAGVTKAECLDIDPTNPHATVVADVTDMAGVPDDTFDCIVFTQVLQLVYDVPSAMRSLHRVLAPGGVLLATVPGILRNAPGKCDYWRFTSWSMRRMTEDAFPGGDVAVQTYGNVLVTTGFMYGLGRNDFDRETFAANDPAFELLIGVRARKVAEAAR